MTYNKLTMINVKYHLPSPPVPPSIGHNWFFRKRTYKIAKMIKRTNNELKNIKAGRGTENKNK